MRKRKRDQIQTPKEPPKDKHGKMKSHLGEELCHQFSWGQHSPQKVQHLAQLACKDMDDVLGGTSKDPSSGISSVTSKDPSSGTSSVASKHPSSGSSSATSKDPYIKLRQLSAIGTCGKHSNNCHRDLMHILEDESMLPMPHKLAVDMSPSLAF